MQGKLKARQGKAREGKGGFQSVSVSSKGRKEKREISVETRVFIFFFNSN
jgi:hypothetical protein